MTTMTRTTVLAVWLSGAVGAVAVLAQTPDLSGTWKLNLGASQLTAGVGLAGLDRGGAPNTIYVTQAANGTLTIGSDHNQGLARAYMVGGESAIPATPNGTVTVKAQWEGRTLVVESTNAAPPGALKELLAISRDGQTLTVTVATAVSGAARTTTLLYTKTQVEAPCRSWPTPCRQ